MVCKLTDSTVAPAVPPVASPLVSTDRTSGVWLRHIAFALTSTAEPSDIRPSTRNCTRSPGATVRGPTISSRTGLTEGSDVVGGGVGRTGESLLQAPSSVATSAAENSRGRTRAGGILSDPHARTKAIAAAASGTLSQKRSRIRGLVLYNAAEAGTGHRVESRRSR